MLRLEDVITTLLFFYLYQEHDLRILSLGFSSGFELFLLFSDLYFTKKVFSLNQKRKKPYNKLENEMSLCSPDLVCWLV